MQAAAPSPPRQRGARLMMLASGFAGLGYQVVWTQQSALWLGHESAAVLAVVTAFFGGLAVGALSLGRRIENSLRPARWYAVCELVMALWASVLMWGMAPFSNSLMGLIGEQPAPVWQWASTFVGSFLVLLPATAAMGATLPAMVRVVGQLREQGQAVAALYACNTLGAVLGVLAAAFWLVPNHGLLRTAGFCVLLNLGCALAAWFLFASKEKSAAGMAKPIASAIAGWVPQPASELNHAVTETTVSSASHLGSPSASKQLVMLLLTTGLLGIGYEVMVVRVISQVAEDTVYTFAMLLAVYLVGTALGAAVYQRWCLRPARSDADGEQLLNRLLCALAAACLLGSFSLWASEHVKLAVLGSMGASFGAALLAEAALALLAFGLPTLVMGALFSHLCVRASAAGFSFARAVGVNTLGAAAAPLLFGVVLAPLFGAKAVMLLITLGYLALTSRPAWSTPKVWTCAGAALALTVWAPALRFVDVPADGQLLSYQEGAMGAVSVVEDANGTRSLHINNRQQEGSSATRVADARQALLPLLLHAAPRQALFLGVGSGVTSGSAALDPGLQVDAVDLLPEVIVASTHFTPALGGVQPNPRLHLLTADARRFVRTTHKRYDLIVSDNFHPARSGAGALYTVEHFTAVRAALAPNGLFCQWLPLHQLDIDSLRSIVRSFMAVYPNARAVLATNSLDTPVIGLLGSTGAQGIHPTNSQSHAQTRIQNAAPELQLSELGLWDEFALLGSFIADPQALTQFANNAALNTDDRPVVAYRAPRVTYAPDSLPRDRLLAVLKELEAASDKSGPTPDADAVWHNRLRNYQLARTRFIEVGRDVRPVSDSARMLAQVRAPLLDVLRISPDFRPAYDPLLRLALALAHSDPIAARGMLMALAQVQPARPEAAQTLREWDGAK
jgi:spermidine synthase